MQVVDWVSNGRNILRHLEPCVFKFKRQTVNSWNQRPIYEKAIIGVLLIIAIISLISLARVALSSTHPLHSFSQEYQSYLGSFCFWLIAFSFGVSLVVILSSTSMKGSKADAEQLLVTPIPKGISIGWIYFETKIASGIISGLIIFAYLVLIMAASSGEIYACVMVSLGFLFAIAIYCFMIVPWVYFLSYRLKEPSFKLGNFSGLAIQKWLSFLGSGCMALIVLPFVSEKLNLYFQLERNPWIRIVFFPATLTTDIFQGIAFGHPLLFIAALIPAIAIGMAGMHKCRLVLDDMYDSITSRAAFLPERVRPDPFDSNEPNRAASRLLLAGSRKIMENPYHAMFMKVRWQNEKSLLWVATVEFLHNNLKDTLQNWLILAITYFSIAATVRIYYPGIVAHLGAIWYYPFFLVSSMSSLSATRVFGKPEIIKPLAFDPKKTVLYALPLSLLGTIIFLVCFESGLFIASKMPAFQCLLFYLLGIIGATLDALLAQTSLLLLPGKLYRKRTESILITIGFDLLTIASIVLTYYFLNEGSLGVGFAFVVSFALALTEIYSIFNLNAWLFGRSEMT